MRHLVYIVPVVVALWYADGVLSKDRRLGWERNCIFEMEERLAQAQGAEAVLLGSSTSVDWMRPEYVARLFKMPASAIADGHINGCHQDCTFAEVRRLLREGRHYRFATYGTNQFQLCEFEEPKRILQQEMVIPISDIPDLFALYGHAEQPLNYVARFVGTYLSGVYGDTLVLQQEWATSLFGSPRGDRHRWHSPRAAPRPAEFYWCDYQPEKIAYKRAMSEALLDDLGRLADRVYLMLLPDQNLSLGNPKIDAAWEAHRRLHAELAAARPQVVLLDLAQPDGARAPAHFTDGFHLTPAGSSRQQRLLERMLREGDPIGAQPAHHPAHWPAQQPAQRAAHQPAQQLAHQPAQQLAQQPAERPAEQLAQR